MITITTHILDLTRGAPAGGIAVTLERIGSPQSTVLARAATDADGRVRQFSPTPSIQAGSYRLIFDTGPYFAAAQLDTFYPRVVVEFEVRDNTQHFHVPLLLSPWGFSTYRGS